MRTASTPRILLASIVSAMFGAFLAARIEISDTARDRIRPGNQAILYGGGSNVLVKIPAGPGNDVIKEWWLENVGTACRVLDDPGGQPTRDVRLVILEGNHQGQVGITARENLRPITK